MTPLGALQLERSKRSSSHELPTGSRQRESDLRAGRSTPRASDDRCTASPSGWRQRNGAIKAGVEPVPSSHAFCTCLRTQAVPQPPGPPQRRGKNLIKSPDFDGYLRMSGYVLPRPCFRPCSHPYSHSCPRPLLQGGFTSAVFVRHGQAIGLDPPCLSLQSLSLESSPQDDHFALPHDRSGSLRSISCLVF